MGCAACESTNRSRHPECFRGLYSSFAPEQVCAFQATNYKSLDKDRKELDTLTRD
jgi:hypothetical protein